MERNEGAARSTMSSLAARALIAIALMVSFYVLAVALSAGLLWLAYEEVVDSGVRHWRFVAFALAGAGSVLWSILPRIDRFEEPGPCVEEGDEPELFVVLRNAAAATNQTMPAEVYFVKDVNAFVTSRGGFMGFGSRRVMGLGLPLLLAVTVQELEAILAHEFGHYHGGDVSLGPWIHKTRAAMGRTMERLGDNMLVVIFYAYAVFFMRVTHAVSRRQEFVADEVAAGAAGAAAMISGLRTTYAAGIAYDAYWNSTLSPVVRSGFLPPVHDGFARFMASNGMAGFLQFVVQQEEQLGRTGVYDSHPSLRERILALSRLGAGVPGDTRRAASLLKHLDRWERGVIGSATGPEWARDLKTIDWPEVGSSVYLPMVRSSVARHVNRLQALTIGSIPTSRAELVKFGSTLFHGGGQDVDEQLRLNTAIQVLGSAIVLQLSANGWTVRALPGEDLSLCRDGLELRPATELPAIVERGTQDEWRSRCVELGIADVPLSGVAAVV